MGSVSHARFLANVTRKNLNTTLDYIKTIRLGGNLRCTDDISN